MLSLTYCRCFSSESLSTMTPPGVAESRVVGVFDPEPGLCLSFNFRLGLGAEFGAEPDMLSLSLGCGGSSTLAFIAASFCLKISWYCQ